MHPARIRPKRRKTVLALTLALGVGLPPPAQAYLLDFTVLSINPEVFISYAPGILSRPPPVVGNLKAIDVSRMGGLGRQFNPTDTVLNRILNFPTGPLVDYFSNVASAPYVEEFGGLSPQGSITLQGGIPDLNMPDDTTLLSGSFGTARVMKPAPVSPNSFYYLAGSNFADKNNDGLLPYSDIPCQPIGDNFNPVFAVRFTSIPGASASTMVPSGNILNHLAPLSSTLLLLGSGLMGLAGLRCRRRRG